MRIATLIALLVPWTAAAGPLATQGRLVDPAGGPITGTHSLTVQVFDSAIGGAELWAQPYDDVDIQDGFYSLNLDGLDPAGRLLDTAVAGSAWMVVSVDGAPMLPRQPLHSVPQALHARTATTAQHATLADHATTTDEAILAELAAEADHATTADVASSVPVINAASACTTAGAIGYDATLAAGAICDGTTWQVLRGNPSNQGEYRLLVADYLRANSDRLGNSSWQYATLPQSYTITTRGGNVRVYFKAMTYLYATQTNGSSQQAGLIIHPIVDGVEQEYCDYLYVRGWGTPDDQHGPIVCDVTYELPAGQHTIGFKHRYYGYRTLLYGGPAKSAIRIEELPRAIDYQGDW